MSSSDRLWNFIAPVYRVLRNNPVSGYFLRKESQAVRSLLQRLDSSDLTTVCDLGVGRGHSLELVSNAYPCKIAIDKSMSMIQFTRDKYSDTQFLVGDILDLPIKQSSFDLIICIGLIEYLPKISSLLSQISSTLKTEGFLLITSSPKNILTFLRIINGHKIYARNSNEVKIHFDNHNFRIVDMKITPMQHQYLLKKVRI